VADLPPRVSPEAEAAVLSASMLDRDARSVCLDLVTPADFFDPKHRIIVEAILWLEERNRDVDPVTVAELLKDSGKWSEEVSRTLFFAVDATPSVSHAGAHARLVRDLARVRRTGSALQLLQAEERSGDLGSAEEWLERVETVVLEATQLRGDEDAGATYERALNLAYSEIGEAHQTGRAPGLWTGLGFVDDLVQGFSRGDWWVIAGRPGMGKTALTQQIGEGIAKSDLTEDGKPTNGVVFFSLEMPRVKLARRSIAQNTEVAISLLRSGKLDSGQWRAVSSALSRAAKLPIVIDDRRRLSPGRLRARLRRHLQELRAKFGPQIRLAAVIVDYLQLMKPDVFRRGRSREEELSDITGSSKDLAGEFDCVVIHDCQLNRAWGTTAQDKRPQLKDLRGSGAIEQDADGVLFVHREDGYKTNRKEHDGSAELIAGKGRDTGTGRSFCRFIDKCAKFHDEQGDLDL
jgi:replicative DNA helicase